MYDPLALVELEIRIGNAEPLGRFDNEAPFFEISHETFLTERRNILPSELFFLNPVDDTLSLSTTVVQAAASAPQSTISLNGDWL